MNAQPSLDPTLETAMNEYLEALDDLKLAYGELQARDSHRSARFVARAHALLVSLDDAGAVAKPRAVAQALTNVTTRMLDLTAEIRASLKELN